LTRKIDPQKTCDLLSKRECPKPKKEDKKSITISKQTFLKQMEALEELMRSEQLFKYLQISRSNG
jgi:hypothetical protein